MLYALHAVINHGLCNSSVQIIFRAVAVAKLLYVSNAWWGFMTVTDCQKVVAFIHCSIHTGFCAPNLTDFCKLYISFDEQLFKKILYCHDHVIRIMRPSPAVQSYNLTNKAHNRQLPDRISPLTDCKCCIVMYTSFYYYSLLFYCYFLFNYCLSIGSKRISYLYFSKIG